MTVTQKAYAKINLSLDVTGRRNDGYHIVRMIMQTVELHDTLTFQQDDTGIIRISSSDKRLTTGKDNLIWKVCELMRKEAGIKSGISISLDKRIPIAAGMAGGSADAAAAFRGLNELFGLGISDEKMCELAVKLGADIPFCILGGTALSEGIGEVLTPLPSMPDCTILICKPQIDVSTGWVYKELDSVRIEDHPDTDAIVEAIQNASIAEICRHMKNVLEPVTGAKFKVIGQIEDIMMETGALNAMMSGSGPTVFGIFENRAKAESAYQMLKEEGHGEQLYISAPVGRLNG